MGLRHSQESGQWPSQMQPHRNFDLARVTAIFSARSGPIVVASFAIR